MNCPTARLALLDEHRGRLGVAAAEALAAHLRECPGCARYEMAERLLTEQLERHLPQHAAPLALKRRLAAQWAPGEGAEVQGRLSGWWWPAAVATVAVAGVLADGWKELRGTPPRARAAAPARVAHEHGGEGGAEAMAAGVKASG
jgi:hypothetical protein